jgi:hypothetical protein
LTNLIIMSSAIFERHIPSEWGISSATRHFQVL